MPADPDPDLVREIVLPRRRISLLTSFRCAFRGLGFALRTQRNARLHLLAAAAVTGLGLFLGLSAGEWVAITLAIALVLGAEIFNTALEFLADALHPEHHPLVGQSKDISAAAVLIAAIASGVIGLIVLGPKAWALVAP